MNSTRGGGLLSSLECSSEFRKFCECSHIIYACLESLAQTQIFLSNLDYLIYSGTRLYQYNEDDFFEFYFCLLPSFFELDFTSNKREAF